MSIGPEHDARAARRARIAALALAWFCVSTLLLVSPVFFWLGNTIEPRVLGLPFALVYVLGVVAINFAVLAVLYAARVIDHVDTDDG